MKAMGDEESPSSVSRQSGTTQGGEAGPTVWGWVEHSVWTPSMLETLQRGVKGGVWFSLIAGPTRSFVPMGCSTSRPPMEHCFGPRRGKTTDWRAGCGRSARPVRREGRRNPMRRPNPYSLVGCSGFRLFALLRPE